MPIVLLTIESCIEIPQINGNDTLKNINFKEIIKLVEQEIVGELVSVDSANGDKVSIVVE